MSDVLVVDDVADIRLLFRLILEGTGHHVREAPSAEKALEQLTAQLPNYVILDISLPGMSGWDLLERMRADSAMDAAQVIVCSAHAGPADVRRARSDGAQAFLAKPFAPRELLALVS